MPSTTKMSFAYYTILVCLAIIGAAFLYGLLWQPSFARGYIFIHFQQGHLMFSLWTFVPALLSLVLFVYYTLNTIRKSYQARPLVPALLSGLVFFLLSFFMPISFGYTGSTPANAEAQNAYALYVFLRLLARASVILVTVILLYKWRKANNNRAADTAAG